MPVVLHPHPQMKPFFVIYKLIVKEINYLSKSCIADFMYKDMNRVVVSGKGDVNETYVEVIGVF